MDENQIADAIVENSIQIHREIGPGLLESVYENILAYELRIHGFEVASQVVIPIKYKGRVIDNAFRADLIVGNKVIVEIKSVEELSKVHKKQLLTYLRMTNLKLGILLNFGEELMKTGIKRVANNL